MNTPLQTQDLLDLYQKKHSQILALFFDCKTPEAMYEKIISLGKSLSKPSDEILEKLNDHHIVKGCQSIVYIFSKMNQEGKIHFDIQSDALISSGLASLLLLMYQEEKPEFILFYPPLFIEELKLNISLSPGRSNGLASMYSRMKQDSLKLLINKKGSSS